MTKGQLILLVLGFGIMALGCSRKYSSTFKELPKSILPSEDHMSLPAYDGESPYAFLPNNGEGSFV